MWDGRQTHAGFSPTENLMAQAQDATLGHAQAAGAPTLQQLRQIVSFETSLCTAQSVDDTAGPLDVEGARGGPRALMDQLFFLGINDPLGFNPTGAPFDEQAFTLYDRWTTAANRRPNLYAAGRQAIARGQQIFNTRKFTVTGVGGLNDALGVRALEVRCTTCHDSPNVGNHSVAMPLNIGISDGSRRTPDMPLYTLRNNATGETRETTDPGRALITGRWSDIGTFKGPILRGLAARPPYFHNGSAATLGDAVQFYDDRFKIGLTPQEKADLVAFLRSL
jgi:hypothetical protein